METIPITYLKKTITYIPESVKHLFPDNDTLRMGIYHYRREIRGKLEGDIYVYLVPRNGSGDKTLVAKIPHEFKGSRDFAEAARRLARDEKRLAEILLQYHAQSIPDLRNANR